MFLRGEEKLFADKVLTQEKRKIDILSPQQGEELQTRINGMFYDKVISFDTIPRISTDNKYFNKM